MSESIVGLPSQNVTQAAFANQSQISVGPTTLVGINGYNSGPAQFIQLHDSATTPANGAVPVNNVSVPATSNYSIDFGVYGMKFVNGVYACNSTTPQTKTIGAADTQFFSRVVTK